MIDDIDHYSYSELEEEIKRILFSICLDSRGYISDKISSGKIAKTQILPFIRRKTITIKPQECSW